jgi:hypothetical protein
VDKEQNKLADSSRAARLVTWRRNLNWRLILASSLFFQNFDHSLNVCRQTISAKENFKI